MSARSSAINKYLQTLGVRRLFCGHKDQWFSDCAFVSGEDVSRYHPIGRIGKATMSQTVSEAVPSISPREKCCPNQPCCSTVVARLSSALPDTR